MRRAVPFRTFGRVALIGVSIACDPGRADDAPRALPVLRLEARDFTFSAPSHSTGGLTRVRLVNHGPSWHEAS